MSVGARAMRANGVAEKFCTGKAEPFVKEMGETMNYHVATDESQPHGKTSVAWMTGKPGVPTAFIVGPDGKITWTGSTGGAGFFFAGYTSRINPISRNAPLNTCPRECLAWAIHI